MTSSGSRPASPRTDLAAGLEYLGRVTKRRSVVFLITDFLTAPPAGAEPDPRVHAVPPRLEHALRVVARKHDLIPVTITDPLEEELPDVGLLNMVDFETGEAVVFDTSGPEARAHARFMHRARELRQTLFRRLKIDFVNVRTDRPYLPALVDFFKARERRLRR